LGLAGGLALLGQIWPEADRSQDAPKTLTAADLAKAPIRSITVLVIGVDSDQLGDPLNGAAPLGPANNDALLLLRINPAAPLQALTIPTSLAVQLPGQRALQPLGTLYRIGGPALTADAVRELVGLTSEQPERYVVISRAGLRKLVDGLGGVNANPPMEMRYSDKRQNLAINLDGGLQQLDGRHIEQLARFRDPLHPDDSRQDNQQEVARSLLQELAVPEQLGRVPGLVGRLKGQVNTNLSEAEILSLLAAGLAQPETVQFSSIPLAPLNNPPVQSSALHTSKQPPGGLGAQRTPLRHIASDAPSPLWPSP
jgi:LCP family protein required for cell wall assembly